MRSISPTSLFPGSHRLSRKGAPLTCGGYTVAEVLIVLAIIGLLASVIVARYRDFESVTLLQSLTYEVALAIREAQVMTISTNINSTDGTSERSFGVYFDENSNTFTLFSDRTGGNENEYDAGENVKTITMTQGSSISSIEARGSGALEPVTDVTMTFERPHLETTFVTPGVANAVEVRLTVLSPKGTTRTITILRSGQISVQ